MILLQHTHYYCHAVTCKICRKFCDQLVTTLVTPRRVAFGRNKIILKLLLWNNKSNNNNNKNYESGSNNNANDKMKIKK